MDDKPRVEADPSGMHRSAHSHPAESFKALHPPDVVQVINLLQHRRTGELGPRYRPTDRLADPREDTVALCGCPILADDQPQSILDKGSEGAPLCGSLASRAIEKIFGKPDG